MFILNDIKNLQLDTYKNKYWNISQRVNFLSDFEDWPTNTSSVLKHYNVSAEYDAIITGP